MRFTGHIDGIINLIATLDASKAYEITIEEFTGKRTLAQNRKLWRLIHTIAKTSGQDDNEIYCELLRRADAKSDYVITKLSKQDLCFYYRGVEFVRLILIEGEIWNNYKVYLGSSLMNKKECSELLEVATAVAIEVGVDYREL